MPAQAAFTLYVYKCSAQPTHVIHTALPSALLYRSQTPTLEPPPPTIPPLSMRRFAM